MKLYELITATDHSIYLDLNDISTLSVVDDIANIVLKNGEKLRIRMASLVGAFNHSEVGLMSIAKEEAVAAE